MERWRARRGMRAAWTVLGALMALYALNATAGLPAPLGRVVEDFGYHALLVAAAVLCLVRPLVERRQRAAWLLVGTGMLAWSVADVYWTLHLSKLDAPPYPSISDAGWLLFYPLTYAAIVLLVRERVRHFYVSVWLDGAIAACAVAALAVTLAFEPIVAMSLEGEPAAVAVNLAYPVGDVLLMALVIGALALTGWRPSPVWVLLGVGCAVSAIADIAYLSQVARDTYRPGTVLEALWPLAALLVAAAAWRRPEPVRDAALDGTRLLVVPALFSMTALALLVADHVSRISTTAVVVAALALVLGVARMVLTFAENVRLLRATHEDATTDALTGLGNRRLLMADLERRLPRAAPGAPLVLMLFDLDGFKAYNDTYGHPAGDALLARLGQDLAAAVGAHDRTYRLGGDEFCVLGDLGRRDAAALAAVASDALVASGDGFAVTSTRGVVVLTAPATPSDALREADVRMYAGKRARPVSAASQTAAVLVRVLAERNAELGEHVDVVTALCGRVADALRLDRDRRAAVIQAASLHDVGKAAIPDAILHKPGPLDEEEWGFMRRHTIIGQRIMAAAPALAEAALLVRSSHERWDGSGYPDALAGEDIPLGARIIAVCDAYDAMVSDRPYRKSIGEAAALAELRRCAGTQFDPAVVEAFARVVRRRPAAAAPAVA